MAGLFEEEGIRFQFPENWTIEREDTDAGWTVALQSPETAFMLLSLRTDMPATDAMAETALEALREDYPDLEADDCVEDIAGQPALGHDIRFFSLDLTNSAWTRSFYSPNGTVLILCQTTDLEAERNLPVLKAICASIELPED